MSSLLDALNPQHRAFVEQYLASPTLNAQDAAIAAGYSPKRAKSQACHMLQRPDVKAAVAAGIAARSERTQIDADWVLRRLADEAEADLADLYTADGALKPVHEWPLIWRQGLVAGMDVEELRSDGAVMGVIRKVKLSDRVKRLELLGKHVGVQAFRERVEHDVRVRQATDMTDAELAAIARGSGE